MDKLKLSKASITRTDMGLMLASFCAYTGMYAARKSFLAGQYDDITLFGDFHFKILLIISQVLGYMLSKFIGIKVVSELPASKRFLTLLALVGFSLGMLLAFAVLPVGLKPIAMFLNGVPLGMIFGLVLVYLEGRENSELLVAGLSATFIFSTGLVKSTGLWLMEALEISEFWMPFCTGLLFFPVFVLSSFWLGKLKGPSEKDKMLRTERLPMGKEERRTFLRAHGPELTFLVLIYVLLTVVRDFRGNFMVEFWTELEGAGKPELITLTEIPIAILVILICSAGILILSNKKAFRLGLLLTLLSGGLMVLVTLLFNQGFLSPVVWMIASGFGVYLPYILFHCMIFERFIAVLKVSGTVGFLFYLADAFGYMGSVGVMFFKEFANPQVSWVGFFSKLSFISGILIVVFVIACHLIMKTNSSKRKLEKIQRKIFY